VKYGKKLLSLCAFVLCAVLAARAQENAELTGSVKDPTGAVVPNAKVTITNSSTGESRTGITNNSGLYDFPGLRIGIYTLVVTTSGFDTYSKTGIVMNVAATVREDAVLTVGSSSQTVTVEANALHLQAETNEISNLITGEQLTQLATNGRNMVSLTTLGTGVSNNLASFNGVTAQGSGFGLSFNGMRPDHNNWLIDGGEAYDRGSGGKFDLMPSLDVIAEFQTLSSNYSPDYGISSGGTITMALKSGTNQFHGGLWEFNRNDAFDAANYFSKQNHQPTPELRLNVFGGDIGGPAFIPGLYPKSKSKTYFFYSEEWRRYISGANPNTTNTVPTANFPTLGHDLAYQPWSEVTASQLAPGVCNAGVAPPCVPFTQDPAKLALYAQDGLTPGNPFPGNVIPANLLDANAVRFMSTGAIPKPNVGTSQYSSSPKQPTYVREDVVRVDHDINERLHLMGHWIHDQMSQTIFPSMWSSDNYTTVGNVFTNPSWASVIKLTQTISPSLLNETALNVNGNTIDITPAGTYAQPSGWDAGSFFTGNNGMNRLPQVSFGAPLGTTWTTNYWPWHNSFLDYQIRDDLSWSKGKHGFKFGFSYMRADKNQQLQADTQGDFSFGTDFSGDSYLNFLLGFADSYAQLNYLATAHWVNNTYSFYGMDNWHITPRLTLNLGVRYDALPHVYEKNNLVSNFVPSAFNYASAQVPNASTGDLNPGGPGFSTVNGVTFYSNGIQLAGVGGSPRGVVKNDYATVQPRIGLAYDLFGTGKTILRAGSGLFYERIQGNDIYGAAINQPFAYKPSANSIYFSSPTTSAITGQASSSPVVPASITNLAYGYSNPATAQFSLGVQQEVARSIVAIMQYVGSAGWHQADQRNINTLPLGDITNRQAVARGAAANLYRIFPGYAGITQEENASNTTYHSLQFGLRIEKKHGLTAQFSYTWSHEIDIASGDLGSTNFAGGQSYVSNPFNLKYDRGSGVLDRRHIFSANYDYAIPLFNRSNGLQHALLGGWEVSGVTAAQTGTPLLVTYSPDTLGLGGGTVNRPNKVGGVSGAKTQLAWFNTKAFAAPTAPWAGGTNDGFGTAGKDSIVGPGLFNWNLSLFKDFALGFREGAKFELRVESFNTFNHTQFRNVDTGFTDSNFGQVTSVYDPRTLQFGAKFLF
jgi:Carboxypeptidase regulatory-like domain